MIDALKFVYKSDTTKIEPIKKFLAAHGKLLNKNHDNSLHIRIIFVH